MTKKHLLKCIITNLITFALCFLMFYLEKAEVESYNTPQYTSPAFLFFLIIMLVYLSVYGCLTYVRTRKIILPNLILFGFVTVFVILLLFYFNVFTIPKTFLNSFKICFFLPLLSSAFSTLFSLITKFILKYLN